MHPDDHARVARNEARRAKWEAERGGWVGNEAAGGSAVENIASTLWGLTTKISSLVLGGGAAAAEAEASAAAKAAAERERRRKQKPPPHPPFVHEGMGRYLVMPDRGFPEDSRETPLMAAIMRGDEGSVLALLEVSKRFTRVYTYACGTMYEQSPTDSTPSHTTMTRARWART